MGQWGTGALGRVASVARKMREEGNGPNFVPKERPRSTRPPASETKPGGLCGVGGEGVFSRWPTASHPTTRLPAGGWCARALAVEPEACRGAKDRSPGGPADLEWIPRDERYRLARKALPTRFNLKEVESWHSNRSSTRTYPVPGVTTSATAATCRRCAGRTAPASPSTSSSTTRRGRSTPIPRATGGTTS